MLKKIGWGAAKLNVINYLKVQLLQHYIEDVFSFYQNRLNIVVYMYIRQLPNYVADREIDDLKTISSLEFVESIKAWDIEKSDDVWPYAQLRIKGALKDHIRYITKSDPSRVYEWISDAAHMFQLIEKEESFLVRKLNCWRQSRRSSQALKKWAAEPQLLNWSPFR